MDDTTKDIYNQIVPFGLTDRNAVKLSLGLIQQVSSGAKITFSKVMFAMENFCVSWRAFTWPRPFGLGRQG